MNMLAGELQITSHKQEKKEKPTKQKRLGYYSLVYCG